MAAVGAAEGVSVAADRISVVPALVVAEWVQGALAGVAEATAGVAEAAAGVAEATAIGVVVIGMAAIGAGATGMVVTGMAVTGTAAIGVITSYSSATSAFPTGGAGAIRTDTTVTVTPTVTMATAMATTATDMVVAMGMITISPVTGNTAIAANQGLLSCSGDSLALAIIVALLTGFWGPRRGERFKLTSAPMEM